MASSTAREREARDRWRRRIDNGEIDYSEKAARERDRTAMLKEKAVKQKAELLAQAARAADLRSLVAGGVVGLGLADREARAGAAAFGAMASPRSPAPHPSPLPSPARILVSPGLQGPFYGSVGGDRYRDHDGPRRASPGPGPGRIDRVPDRGPDRVPDRGPDRGPDRVPDPTFLEHVNIMSNLADMVHMVDQADQLRDQLRTQAMSMRSPE